MPEHTVFHVRGKNSFQWAGFWKYGLVCGVVLICIIIAMVVMMKNGKNRDIRSI